MPRHQINYSNCQIYKIVCNNIAIKHCYVGHTTNFANRKRHHKEACYYETDKHHNYIIYKTIREFGGWDNWSMILVEDFPCKTFLEACQRERYWLEQLQATLNTRIPSRGKKEYMETHVKEKAEYDKKRREDLSDKIREEKKKYYETIDKERRREKFTCECGCLVSKSNKLGHNKTERHKNKILSINIQNAKENSTV